MTNRAPQSTPASPTAPGPAAAPEAPPSAYVLDRFGLDLTSLAVLNETARQAEGLLAHWFCPARGPARRSLL